MTVVLIIIFNERKLVLGLQRVKVTVKIKVQMEKLSFGRKTVILSFSKLNIESKTFFLKTGSVGYATQEHGIKGESLAFPWSHGSQLVTFVTNHQIKKILFQSISLTKREIKKKSFTKVVMFVISI